MLRKSLLAGTGVFLLYCGWRVWRHKAEMHQRPDEFAGWEGEIERIFGRRY